MKRALLRSQGRVAWGVQPTLVDGGGRGWLPPHPVFFNTGLTLPVSEDGQRDLSSALEKRRPLAREALAA